MANKANDGFDRRDLTDPPRAKTVVMVIYGPPGSGKSHIATALGREDPTLCVLRNDVIRKELGLPAIGSAYTERVYEEVQRRAELAIRAGITVVIDATFYLRRYRRIVFDPLVNLEVHWVLVRLETPIHVCRARIAARNAAFGDRVEGVDDLATFDSLILRTEPVSPSEYPPDSSAIAVDGTGPTPRVLNFSRNVPAKVLAGLENICMETDP